MAFSFHFVQDESDWFGALAEDLLESSSQYDSGRTAPPFATASTLHEPELPLVRVGSPSSQSESSSTAMSDTPWPAPPFAAAPSQFSPDPYMLSSHLETSPCWGALFSGNSNGSEHRHSRCTGSVSSAGNKKMSFPDRFCAACRHPDGFLVPTDRVRALKIHIGEPVLTNSRTTGAWTVGQMSGSPPFRVANNTLSCVGPNLVIFESPLPVVS